MDTIQKITAYIQSQPEPKRNELQQLHERISAFFENGPLWFLDGKNEQGKVVSNPNIGYGSQIMNYANGTTKAFYQVGLSANTSGISVYIMGIANKKLLPETVGATIGKANVTGYCIKFKSIADIDLKVLDKAIGLGLEQS